ncbi:MAG: glycoside hydrolase family 16 protein [Roseateles sp.]|uniref:glycoside hydrolase family 16 protein n=1 Tax=Roseateles sp. TaxID=1971397 RepID=UPI004034FE31
MQAIPRAPRPWRSFLPAFAAALTACGGGGGSATAAPAPAPVAAPAPTPAPAPAPAPAPSNNWTLTWSDEFDDPAGTVPKAGNWNYDLGNAENNGWGNREFQYYTANPRNAQTDGAGMLVITAEKATNPGPCWNNKPCDYTSARIHTNNKVSFTYGKVEARMKLPTGKGVWPAFWTLGTDIATNPWPKSGEIDIMEFVPQTPNSTYGTLHGPGYSGAQGIGKSVDLGAPVINDFHTYTIVKRPNEIIWYVDGKEFHRLTPANLPAGGTWVFEKPFFVILNLAVGGDWPGAPDATTPLPARMLVDWVRIYKEN